MADEIKWTVREYQGTEVFRYNAADHPNGLDSSKLIPVRQKDGIVEGDHILVAALTGGYHLMKVDPSESGESLYGVGDKLMAVLEFGRDDRECWVCSGLINLRGVEKLRITT